MPTYLQGNLFAEPFSVQFPGEIVQIPGGSLWKSATPSSVPLVGGGSLVTSWGPRLSKQSEAGPLGGRTGAPRVQDALPSPVLPLRPFKARHSLPEAWGDLCSQLCISDREFGPLQADALSSRRLGRRSEGAGARARQLQPTPGAEAGVHPAPARPSPGQAGPPPRAAPSEPHGRPAGLQGGSRRPPGRTHPWR